MRLIVIFLTIVLAACAPETAQDSTRQAAPPRKSELNLYSSRHYDTDLRLYADFEERTGITINRIEAGADELIERIRAEGEFSPGDLLITVDAGRLVRAQEAGLFQPVQSEALNAAIPAHLRDPDGEWYGLTTRARVIIFNRARINPQGLTRYRDLADPRFGGEVCMRSSSNIYNISMMAALLHHQGREAALDWARGVVANFARPAQGNDTAQITAVASGECGLSLVNTYYLARIIAQESGDAPRLLDQLGVIFPDADGDGTHINISGAGLLKHAPNRKNAVVFLEYLASPSAQAYLANGNFEYPVIEGARQGPALDTLGAFKADPLNVSVLGLNQNEAVKIFEEAGWP
jgi:iron(III) transport system substrate-binding protein